MTFLSYKLAGIGWHVTAADSRGLESRLWPPACGGLICLQAGDFLTTQLFLLTVACTFSCMMKFTVKDCDPTTGETNDEGYEDEYLDVADYIQKVMKLNFEAAWDEVGDEFEKE